MAAVEKLPFGDPAEASTVVGPVIDEGARSAVVDAANGARNAGGRIVTGGTAAGDKGWFVQPTLVDGISPRSRIGSKRGLRPHRSPAPGVRTLTKLWPSQTASPTGFRRAVFTTDLDRALAVSGRLEAGMVKVNGPTSGVDFYAPFGGVKGSSYGPREQGKAARDFYTWSQTITVSPARA